MVNGPWSATSGIGRVLRGVERTFAEEVLARAIVVLGDERAEEDDREDAALVIVCAAQAPFFWRSRR